jgi:RNA polymerase sigma factor (sigma-70 family)
VSDGEWVLRETVPVERVDTRGSRTHLADAYRRLGPQLSRFATGVVGPDDAADVLSDVLVRLSARDLDHVENIEAYLYQAVMNQCRNHLRTRLRRRDRDTRVAAMTHGSEVDASNELDSRLDVERWLITLSLRQRAVVALVYGADQTVDVAARNLGITPGTARRHLARALNRLRREHPDGP